MGWVFMLGVICEVVYSCLWVQRLCVCVIMLVVECVTGIYNVNVCERGVCKMVRISAAGKWCVKGGSCSVQYGEAHT